MLADVARAEAAAHQVHAAFRELERRHGGASKPGKATLEVGGRVDACVDCDTALRVQAASFGCTLMPAQPSPAFLPGPALHMQAQPLDGCVVCKPVPASPASIAIGQ